MKDVKLLLADLHPDVCELFETARTQVELTTMVRTIVFLRKRFPDLVDAMGNPEASKDAPPTPLVITERPAEPERSHRVVLRSSGKNKIDVIRAVRMITMRGLKQAKDICDDADEGKYANAVLRTGLNMEAAREIQARIECLGGMVTIE